MKQIIEGSRQMRVKIFLTNEHVERHHDVKDDPALLPLLLVEDGAGELRDRGLDAVIRRGITRGNNFHASHFLKQRKLLHCQFLSVMTPSKFIAI